MSAALFLLAMIGVLWLGVWIFDEPKAAEPSRNPRAAPFDYVEAKPAAPAAAAGAGWRQRRAQSKTRP
jgi:hypothetical protein